MSEIVRCCETLEAYQMHLRALRIRLRKVVLLGFRCSGEAESGGEFADDEMGLLLSHEERGARKREEP